MSSATWHYTCTCSSCCQRLKRLWDRILDVRPIEAPEDEDCRLWFERITISRFDLLLPFLQAFFVLLDTGIDLQVAASHYHYGHHYWALYTIIIVVVTQIFLQVVSACWFMEDRNDRTQKQTAMEENGVQVTPWVLICHLMVFGRFVRFYQNWKVLRSIRKGDDMPLEDQSARSRFIRRYMLYIAQTQDCNTLLLMEAFLEQAPQVTLQLYILMKSGHVDLTSPNDLLITLNVIKSLLFFALSHLTYARDMRRKEENSAQLAWLSKGAASLYFWRLFMLVSRMLALALFASAYKAVYTSVLIAVHFLLFLIILTKQECNYFEECAKKQFLLKCAFAYIHIFCFFPLVPKETGKWGYVYYCITFLENTFVLLLWACHSKIEFVFQVVAIAVEKVCFGLGLLFLALYYRLFHPSVVTRARPDSRSNSREVLHITL